MVKIASRRSVVYKKRNKQTLLSDKQENLKNLSQLITFLTFFSLILILISFFLNSKQKKYFDIKIFNKRLKKVPNILILSI